MFKAVIFDMDGVLVDKIWNNLKVFIRVMEQK